MKRAIVTGGAGFIGSHLCKKLLEMGLAVTCVDNFFTGRMKNILPLKSNKNFRVVKHDVIEPLKEKGEWIFNLACPASPVHYQADPVWTIKTGMLGALNLLELARKNHARILQASTSEVYGDPDVHPQTEKYWGNVNPIGIRSCYDEGKRIAETLFMDYNRKYKTDIKIIRIFNTFGPNMLENDGRVVSNFIVQALRNEDITVYGEGQQTRSFCYVSDLVDGIVRMMGSEDFTGPVNLGNPGEYTVMELAKMVIEMTGSKSKIVHKPLPSDDPKKRKPDISLATSKLGWKPAVPVQEGLKKTIEYFRNEIKG